MRSSKGTFRSYLQKGRTKSHPGNNHLSGYIIYAENLIFV